MDKEQKLPTVDEVMDAVQRFGDAVGFEEGSGRSDDEGPSGEKYSVRELVTQLHAEATRCRHAVERIVEMLNDGDMPAVGGIVQHDLVSRSYVKLAAVIEEEWEAVKSGSEARND